MEDVGDASEASISMGPAIIMSGLDETNDPFNETSLQETSYISPLRPTNPLHSAMGNLSLSSIIPADTGQPVHLMSILSPDNEFKPDILMSTFNAKPSDSLNDLSISFGPLSSLSPVSRETLQSAHSVQMAKLDSSISGKIQQLEQKRKQAQNVVTIGSKMYVNGFTQTEKFLCLRCDEAQRCFDKKLLEMAQEFQQQYHTQFQLVEEHNAANEEAHKQVRDLMEQLLAADSQLKANRLFLEQQAVEREQEREEASVQLKSLQLALAEKEKECERGKSYTSQIATELQQLQDALKDKDAQIQKYSATQLRMEQELQSLQINQSDLDEENSSLQQVLAVKDKLLMAQADQIAALQTELENQLHLLQSESEATEDVPRQPPIFITRELSMDLTREPPPDMPSLFYELQEMIVQLTHKVEQSTRTLEAVQCSKPQSTSTLTSPRSHITPATSTEDISVKDRTRRTSIENLRDMSPSPPLVRNGSVPVQPEETLNFLQQLQNKMAALSRAEEAACKRISDLELELRRTLQSEKQMSSRATESEEKLKQLQIILSNNDAEKKNLLDTHSELLKRISSLENRLDEQRRSAALSLSQNPYSEKIRCLSEEKQELMQVVLQKEESMAQLQEQVTQLQQRIGSLIQDKEQDMKRHDEYPIGERLRHDFQSQQQDTSLSWSKLHVANSPVALSPVFQPQQLKEIPSAVHFELEELRSKLAKSRQESQALCDQLNSHLCRVQQLEPLEQRCAELESQLQNDQKRFASLEEQLASSQNECQTLDHRLTDQKSRSDRLESVEIQLKSIEQHCAALEDQLATSRRECQSLQDQVTADKNRCDQLRSMEQELKQSKETCLRLENQLTANEHQSRALEQKLSRQFNRLEESEALGRELRESQERCALLESQLTDANRHCAELESVLADKKKRIGELEAGTARQQVAHDQLKAQMNAAMVVKERIEDEILRKSAVLEAEMEAHKVTKCALQALQQRYAAQTRDATASRDQTQQDLQSAKQQCSALESHLEERDRVIRELHTQLQLANSCKGQVEKALQQLQREVQLVKQVQQMHEEQRAIHSRESFLSVPEGPAAPPDLLAPSFVEFLGSTTGSCKSGDSGRKSNITLLSQRSGFLALPRTSESTMDFSLPNSMLGKKTLRSVQQESEQLLRQLMELERRKVVCQNQTDDTRMNPHQQRRDSPPPVDDLESTLKAEEDSCDILQMEKRIATERQLLKKIQLLENELSLERLLFQDQRTANALQQEQIIELIAQQRQQQQQLQSQSQSQQQSQTTIMTGRSSKVVYRAMKLESIRKSLIFQKKFLTTAFNELIPMAAPFKNSNPIPCLRFKAAVFVIISIHRMRFIHQHWYNRRKMMDVK